jgi:HEPN domain-containing protein
LAFTRTHSIADLLVLARGAGIDVPSDVAEAVVLTTYAVEARYPSSGEPVQEDEWGRAVRLAERVVTWVGGLVDEDTKPPTT